MVFRCRLSRPDRPVSNHRPCGCQSRRSPASTAGAELLAADQLAIAKFVISYNQFPKAKNHRRETPMPKLALPKIDDVAAIDIHTHAEEPCGMHGDDGYDDFQEQMAD